MNFWNSYIKLKTAIGGNREHQHYEESFGLPIEEQQYITPPSPHHKRLLSQLEFALRLNDEQGGCFDGCIGKAMDYLTQAMRQDGTLTRGVCSQAEELLLPCRDAAKAYKLILAGHAHIDMDWMWSYHETVALTLSTFRTVLNLMKEYPQFCFSQSQASVYKMVEEYAPEMMEEIRERIRQGRWEVTASAWVEADKNMPNTESLLRHIRYTKNYLRRSWGIDADKLEIDFSPDTFGHSANIPEIDAFGGVKYMYHCRALDGEPSLYRWRSPSGKELLVYREQYWYNSGITPKIGLGLIDISKTCAGFKTGLIVYGVGDHGGGPTRRDIEAALDMMEWPVWPRVQFGTFAQFYHEAEEIREQLPVIDHALNFVFAGCYTTQTRIKAANRKVEATLTDAELWMTLSGKPFRQDFHEKAWQNVLYAHFHDIITGSCVQDSREHAMGQFQKTFAYAQSQYRGSLERLAARIDTSSIPTDSAIALTQSEGAGGAFHMGPNVGIGSPEGVGFHVGFHNGIPNPERGCGKTRIFHIFNSTTTAHRSVVELTVWDWVGDLRRIRFTDCCGNVLRHQLMDGKPQWYWDHRFLRILVEAELLPLGYTTVIMEEAEATGYPVYRQPPMRSEYPFDDVVLENEFIRAVFHRSSGCLISMTDKENGREYIRPGEAACLNVVTMERRTNSAWKIGRYLHTDPLTQPLNIEEKTQGALQTSFTATYRWGQSKLKVTPILQAGEKALRFCIEAEWNEVTGQDTAPLLTFGVPLNFQARSFLCDIPGGSIYRQGRNQDIPCLSYCAALPGDGTALALIPDSKYGYRATEDTLAVSLINTSNNPDPFPDRGLHTVNLALAISREDPKLLSDTAATFNHSPSVLSANAHKGDLPMAHSFLKLEAVSTVLSAVLPTEDPQTFCIRLYETAGKDDSLHLKLQKAPKSAHCVDLSGREVPSDIVCSGNIISLTVKHNTLCQVKLCF